MADLLRKYGVSEANFFFKWRSKYGGASVSDVKRRRELETEDTKLKRMYADLAIENAGHQRRLGPRDVFDERADGHRRAPGWRRLRPRRGRQHEQTQHNQAVS